MPPPATQAPAVSGGLLRNLRVSRKLFAGFGAPTLLVVAMGTIGLIDLNTEFSGAVAEHHAARDERLVPAAERDDMGAYLGAENAHLDPLTARIAASLAALMRAAAVEEQTATTNELSRNVGEVAEVAVATAETTDTAGTADSLSQVVRELQAGLAMFRY